MSAYGLWSGWHRVDHQHIDLAVDANGHRYTSHTFAKSCDPWRGATILSPAVIADLRERGLLPLAEIAPTEETP